MPSATKDYSLSKPIRQVLAENLRTFMRDMTVTSLARDAGISRGQVNNILKQKSATTIDALESLARVVNVFPALLIFLEDSDGMGVDEYLEWVHERINKREDETAAMAISVLVHSFMTTDDEGKMALLRHAAADVGIVPDTVGVKLPRTWREVAPIMEKLITESHASD